MPKRWVHSERMKWILSDYISSGARPTVSKCNCCLITQLWFGGLNVRSRPEGGPQPFYSHLYHQLTLSLFFLPSFLSSFRPKRALKYLQTHQRTQRQADTQAAPGRYLQSPFQLDDDDDDEEEEEEVDSNSRSAAAESEWVSEWEASLSWFQGRSKEILRGALHLHLTN